MTKAFFRTLIYGFLFIGFISSLQAQQWAAVKRGNKWFFIDKTGNLTINKLYDSVGDRFVNGLAPAMLNGKWGYINTTGKMVIPNKFSQAKNFYEGKALVQKNNSWQIINTSGKTILTLNIQIQEFMAIAEGISLVETTDGPAYILPSGKILRPGKDYTDFQPFGKGLARVKKGSKFGFIDTSGNLKIPAVYEAAASFKDTITSALLGSFHQIINMKGQTVEPLPHMYDVVSFNRGSAPLPTPINYTVYRTGGIKIKSDLPYGDNLVTTYVYPFSEDIALFWSQSTVGGFRFGYMLANGKLMNPYRYEWARDFSNGLAAVKLNGNYGYINTRGDMVIDAIYDDALSFYPVK